MRISAKWIELENTTPSKVTKTQKDKHCLFFLICGFQF